VKLPQHLYICIMNEPLDFAFFDRCDNIVSCVLNHHKSHSMLSLSQISWNISSGQIRYRKNKWYYRECYLCNNNEATDFIIHFCLYVRQERVLYQSIFISSLCYSRQLEKTVVCYFFIFIKVPVEKNSKTKISDISHKMSNKSQSFVL
jgi:hypothetical protein